MRTWPWKPPASNLRLLCMWNWRALLQYLDLTVGWYRLVGDFLRQRCFEMGSSCYEMLCNYTFKIEISSLQTIPRKKYCFPVWILCCPRRYFRIRGIEADTHKEQPALQKRALDSLSADILDTWMGNTKAWVVNEGRNMIECIKLAIGFPKLASGAVLEGMCSCWAS